MSDTAMVTPENQASEQGPRTCNITSLINCLCAAHLGRYVQSPFSSYGGVMLIAPVGHFKTTLLSILVEAYPGVLPLSDMNVTTLMRMKDEISCNRVQTLALFDLQKIYERDPRSASNLEGSLRALADEGFSSASFQDSRMNQLVARCAVMGAMPPGFFANHFSHWAESGFLRRFLWCLFRLQDPELLMESVIQERKVEFGTVAIPTPSNRSIPAVLTVNERRKMRELVNYQYGEPVPFIVLCRIANVLIWHYGHGYEARKARALAMRDVHEFAQTLTKGGADIVINGLGEPGKVKR